MGHGLALVEKEELTQQDAIAWAAYHALQQPPMEDPPVMCALLPLFYEKAATPAIIKHGMDVQKQAIEYLNPGQIPVTTFDQPLFALAKYVQWKWPATHGEAVHVVILGGLHTEMALWSTLGDILEGSGWTTALIEVQEAFMEFEGNASVEAWRNDLFKRSPTFMYWDLIMRYETLILISIRAHREKNFPLYVQIL